MKLRIFEYFDYILLLCVVLLISIGIASIYSAGINSDGLNVSNEYVKQIVFASTGLILIFAAAVFDYRKVKRIAPKLFIGLILVLIYTRIFGKYVNGARSWLGIGAFGIQPSEFGKIIYIFFLAYFLESSSGMSERKRFIFSLCILCVPLGLILLQPDLGTASVYVPIFLVMAFMANIPLRYILMVFCGGLFTIILTVLPVWEQEILQTSIPIMRVLTDQRFRFIIIAALGCATVISMIGKILFNTKYYYWLSYVCGIATFAMTASIAAGKVLKDYQIKRLIVFIDPNSDPLGAGWNIIQSKIAIGSGNLFGQGFLKGTQSHYRFLPQQSTDFIFSIMSEEWGFIGVSVVCLLFLIMLLRIVYIIKNTNDTFGIYIASGILTMFFFHFMVNVGMVMGMMPITGIPLLFLSYGGSSLWTAMLCIGIIMSIRARRLDFSEI